MKSICYSPLKIEEVLELIFPTLCKEEIQQIIVKSRNRPGMSLMGEDELVVPKSYGLPFELVFRNKIVEFSEYSDNQQVSGVEQKIQERIEMKHPGCAFVRKLLKLVSIMLMAQCKIGVCDVAVVDGVSYIYEVQGDVVNISGTKNTAGVARLNIPSEIAGHKVTTFGKDSFFRCKAGEIVIPVTVTNIHPCAFMSDYDYSYNIKKGMPCIASNIFFKCSAPTFNGQTEGLEHGNGQFYCKKIYVDTRHYQSYLDKFKSFNRGYSDNEICGANFAVGFASVDFIPSTPIVAKNSVVALQCSDADAQIFYTTDGSDPVAVEIGSSRKYISPIEISSRTIIKATASARAYDYSFIECKDFAFGKMDVPTISADLSSPFGCSNNKIVIASAIDSSYVRFSTNGCEVSDSCEIYAGKLVISETTTIRAKAYKKDWLDSEEVVQTFTRLWYTNETPVIVAEGETFSAASQEVSLVSDTADATIYYTIDGSEPSAKNGRLYKEPFKIYQTTTVKAIAVKDDWKDSAVASATYTKVNALGPAINSLETLPDNDAEHPWQVVTDETHDGVSAVKNGTIDDDESTTMKLVLYGAGRLSFWWKVASEPAIGGEYYDYATFCNGSTEVTRIAGATDWQQVCLDVTGTGKHTFKWTFTKDDSGSTSPEGVWVDQVQWLPQTTDYYSDHTLTTRHPVPYSWLDRYGYSQITDFESAAHGANGKCDVDGKELSVEDDYVAGTDPTNVNSRFETFLTMSNGLPKVTWKPDLNESGTKSVRDYKIWGKAALADEWEYPTNALHRFFKVTVGLP